MAERQDTMRDVLATGSNRQYLTFRVGADDFGVDILRVVEIRGFGGVRTVP